MSVSKKHLEKAEKPPKPNELLALQIVDEGLPAPYVDYKFHPTRKWALDLAWPDLGLAVEVEGGIWMQTTEGRSKGHANPVRFLQDIEKYNEAQLAGFRLFRVTPKMVEDLSALALVKRIFRYIKRLSEKKGVTDGL